jgi:hypothetical protein
VKRDMGKGQAKKCFCVRPVHALYRVLFGMMGIIRSSLIGKRLSKLDSDLFLNGLSDRRPFRHSITIPSNSAMPNTIEGAYHPIC